MVKASFARLDSFARGQAVALAREGLKAGTIRKKIVKKDGRHPTARAVRDLVGREWKERFCKE